MTLQILRQTRAILENNWCRGTLQDGDKFCVQGAYAKSARAFGTFAAFEESESAWRAINESARRLHPHLLKDRTFRERITQLFWGLFLNNWCPLKHPAIYINDLLGHRAILAVLDDAIVNEELRELLAAGKCHLGHPLLDGVCPWCEGVPERRTTDDFRDGSEGADEAELNWDLRHERERL